MVSPLTKLNPKVRSLLRHFIVHFNATRAAIQAGYSPKTAKVQACQIMGRPQVREALAWLYDREGLTPERMAAWMAELLSVDLADFEPWLNGSMSLAELRDSGVDTALIDAAAITVTKDGGSHRLERAKRLDVLNSLAKLRGMLVDKSQVEHSGMVITVGVTKTYEQEQSKGGDS